MPTAEHDGIEIYYETAGSGPAVVLLHSFLCSGTMWAGQVGPLAQHYRVINIDARGHGRSSRVTSPFTYHDTVGDVTAVLDCAGVTTAVWAGLSMGGFTALRAALTVPDRVSGLILLDTGAGAEPALIKLKYAAMALIVRLFGVRVMTRPVSRIMLGRSTHERQPELVSRWCRELREVDVPSVMHTLNALMVRDDLTARLPEIRHPVLVLVGAEDRARPPGDARQLTAGLPHATYVEIPGAGHLSSLEQPARVTEAMLPFLNTVTVR